MAETCCGRPSASGSTSFELPSIGQYSHKIVLHQGRYSTVWSARDRGGATMVVKAYYKLKMRPRHVRHVVRETRLLQILRDAGCSGVVRLDHAFEDDTCVYLVFDPCMKGDLYQLMMKQNGRLQESFVACQVIGPLLNTLMLLHDLGIVHRDIKTENIFLTSSGEVQLGDFGLVVHKVHDSLEDRVGTLDYMAPEVLAMPSESSRKDIYNEKVDVWAMGVLLYELLVGKPPFEVDDATETTRRILACEMSDMPQHIPSDCAEFIRWALTVSPADRPSASQLLHHRWLQRHMSRLQGMPGRPQETPLDVDQIKQQIDQAWQIDALERSLAAMKTSSGSQRTTPNSSMKSDMRWSNSAPDMYANGCQIRAADGKATEPQAAPTLEVSPSASMATSVASISKASPRTSPNSLEVMRALGESLSGSFKVLGHDLIQAVSIRSSSKQGAKAAASSGSVPVSNDRLRSSNEEWRGPGAGSLASKDSGCFTSPNTPQRGQWHAMSDALGHSQSFTTADSSKTQVWQRPQTASRTAGRSRFAS
uniref:Protein kinase domain-containing protein n=1 Tax=Chlamydomonas euryale TaxID=1486919 RepID=A0A7R9V348_9CHLO|mmetsp:Transcript_16975/g.50874  ORF Transcript_16975/g.50874 Transcript_16975/m.50874 type:complete len:535 (+) Transcript_16975:281-1885(+)